jgi:hypothetical protein
MDFPGSARADVHVIRNIRQTTRTLWRKPRFNQTSHRLQPLAEGRPFIAKPMMSAAIAPFI